MHEGHRHGALAYSGSATLDGIVPHIARRKYTGHAGLQIIRNSVERPTARGLMVVLQVGTSHKISCFVADDPEFCRPSRMGSTADTNEEPPGRECLLLPSPAIGDRDRLQDSVAVKRGHLRLGENSDVLRRHDTV